MDGRADVLRPAAEGLDDELAEFGLVVLFQFRRFVDAPVLDGEVGRGEEVADLLADDFGNAVGG